jgi:hypothetical protein
MVYHHRFGRMFGAAPWRVRIYSDVRVAGAMAILGESAAVAPRHCRCSRQTDFGAAN